jgi:CRP/FNR family transcriptional regulator, cyclic AMP receptor protein
MTHHETEATLSRATRVLTSAEFPTLDQLSPNVRLLVERGDLRRYPRGALIIQEGDQGDTLYIVLQGQLRAFGADDQGREITYGIYGPGEYLGEMSLDGGPRSASVVTLEPSVCVVITRDVLTEFIRDVPQFTYELLAKVIHRARSVTASAKRLALNDVYGRLRLLLLSREQASGRHEVSPVEIRLTHQDIASHIGCSREMVSRLMKDLERGGYIAQQRGRITILNTLPSRW